MLDYDGTIKATTPAPPGEESSRGCITGPETGHFSIAKEVVGFLAGAVPV
jgi:hypothetical protein